MAVRAARPFPHEFNLTTSSLPIDDRDFSRHLHGPAPLARSFNSGETGTTRSGPLRAQSALELNGGARLTRCVNGQITPTSPDLPPIQRPFESHWSFSTVSSSKTSQTATLDSNFHRSDSFEVEPPIVARHFRAPSSTLPTRLRSPIRFQTDVDIKQDDHELDFQICPECQDECVDVDVVDDVDDESFHSSDWDLNAPRRRLSYGEPLDCIETSALLNSEEPLVSRKKISWPSIEKQCGSWLDDTVKAQVTRPYHSDPLPATHRVWLDLSDEDQEDMIEEAQATTVTSSPTKPRVIDIPRRRAATLPPPRTPSATSQAAYFGPEGSPRVPPTPPPTPASIVRSETCKGMIDLAPFPPIGLGLETPVRPPTPCQPRGSKSAESHRRKKQPEAFNRIRSRSTWSMAHTNPGHKTLLTTNTMRRVDLSSNDLRPPTPTPIVDNDFKLGETTTWILSELETALAETATRRLKLDSPVVQQISLPPNLRRIPGSEALIIPQSIYSIDKPPLSDRRPSFQLSHTSKPSSAHPIPASSNSDSNLTILRRIFPRSSTAALSHLLAMNLALDFVSGINIPPSILYPHKFSPPPSYNPSLPQPPPYRPSQSPSSFPNYIPSKACAMLGLLPPPSRPPLPAFWRKAEQREWAERILELEDGLRDESRRIMEEMFKREEHDNGIDMIDALSRAVVEVAKIGGDVEEGAGLVDEVF